MKNGLEISGVLQNVDANMNFNLTNISVNDPEKFPHMVNFLIFFKKKFILKKKKKKNIKNNKFNRFHSKIVSSEVLLLDIFTFLLMKWILNCWRMPAKRN